jgi:hypothetical protein
MAVPKKTHIKLRRMLERQIEKKKGYKAAQKSLSLAKSMLSKTTSFVYSIYVDEE